jgi:hypothetical protein
MTPVSMTRRINAASKYLEGIVHRDSGTTIRSGFEVEPCLGADLCALRFDLAGFVFLDIAPYYIEAAKSLANLYKKIPVETGR